MRKARTVFILGIWVAVLPHLGFPDYLDKILFALSGLILIYVGYEMYKALKIKKEKNFDNFSENGGINKDMNLN